MFAPSRLAALVKEMKRHFHAQTMAENAVNNEENVNSQSSQLEEEDLQKLEAVSYTHLTLPTSDLV